MLPTIQKSERFQQEFLKYQTTINSITNEQIKNEAKQLLSKLVAEVKALDINHTQIATAKQLPAITSEIRDRVATIRKQLDKKLKDWTEVQPR